MGTATTAGAATGDPALVAAGIGADYLMGLNSANDASKRQASNIRRYHQRNVWSLKQSGINPMFVYGKGAPAPQAAAPQAQVPSATTAALGHINAANQATAINADINQKEYQNAVMEVEYHLKTNMLPGSEAVAEMGEVLLNLIRAVKGRIEGSTGGIDNSMGQATSLLSKGFTKLKELGGNALDFIERAKEAAGDAWNNIEQYFSNQYDKHKGR